MKLPVHEGPHPAQAAPFFAEQIETMARELAAARDVDGLGEFAAGRTLPAAFFLHFNAALSCFDRIIDFVLAYDGTDKSVKCAKGCCNCCVDLVRGITPGEVVNIYHHVRGWPDARRLFTYHRESAELFMAILAGKLKPDEPAPAGDDPRVEAAHREYNGRNRPCGFLDRETGCCRIYPVRPIACRFFFSLDPPEDCTPLSPRYFRRDTRTVHLPPEIHGLLMEIGERLGVRTVNYLSGAFTQFTSEVMRAQPIRVSG